MTSSRISVRERGFALMIVLWIVGIFSLLVATLFSESHSEAKLSSMLQAEAAGRAAADGAISSVVMEILRSGSASPGLRPFGRVRVTIELEELSGRINPNLASVEILNALLVRVGVEPRRAAALAAAIVDWLEPGQAASPNGAKTPEYRAAGLAYGPPGRPFERIGELGFVLGMTPDVLAALKPHLTLWTTTDPDPALADAVVLAALRASGVPVASDRLNVARVIGITATASAADAPRVTRYAVVSFGYTRDGRGWRILQWSDGENRD